MSEEKKNNRSGNKIIDITKSKKIRPITFSQEELEDPEMDEMIRESIKQEADRLEEELNNDPELMGVGASDDLFLSIVNRLKEQGVWEEEDLPEEEDELQSSEEEDAETEEIKEAKEIEEIAEINVQDVDNLPEKEEVCAKQEDIYQMLPEEDLQALMLGREVARQKEAKKAKRRKQLRHARQIASVAAIFVIVFMVGMTSEANRRLVLKAWDAVMTVAGFKVVTNYSESENTVREVDEKERLAWEDVGERLGVSGLVFSYLPEGMEFEQYEVMEVYRTATFMYAFDENILDIKIIDLENDTSVYYVKDENASLVDSVDIDKKIKAEIWRINSGLGMETYLIEFEHNDCRYMMSGVISLEEIKKIMKNMIFL